MYQQNLAHSFYWSLCAINADKLQDIRSPVNRKGECIFPSHGNDEDCLHSRIEEQKMCQPKFHTLIRTINSVRRQTQMFFLGCGSDQTTAIKFSVHEYIRQLVVAWRSYTFTRPASAS